MYIEDTIKSLISQTILPIKWVIVSDGSTDGTDYIVKKYIKNYSFMEFIHIYSNKKRNFSSKVQAFLTGFQKLSNVKYDYIGNLDADVTFKSDFFERLIYKFVENPNLGIAGGAIYEFQNGKYKPRAGNRSRSVPGAVHLFNYKCYEHTGGFIPIELGGEDTAAQVMARMAGWEVKSFSELIVLHHGRKPIRMATHLRTMFKLGVKDYMLGYHPLYLMAKCIRRLTRRPYLIGSLMSFLGYSFSAIRSDQRPVKKDFIRYIRREQIKKLQSFFQ